jgi:hypothetical protein
LLLRQLALPLGLVLLVLLLDPYVAAFWVRMVLHLMAWVVIAAVLFYSDLRRLWVRR